MTETPSLNLFDPSLPLDNEQHERFCLELLAGKNQTRAYQLTYRCDYATAGANGCRLLKDARVKARLDWLKAEFPKQILSADDVLSALSAAAKVDPADLYGEDGKILPVSEMPPQVRLSIEKIDCDPSCGSGGIKTLHFISKKQVLELMGRHHKLFTDKMEVSHRHTLEDLLSDDEGQE